MPENLDPFAAEILEGLEEQAASEAIFIGGVALQGDPDHRKTVDRDAW